MIKISIESKLDNDNHLIGLFQITEGKEYLPEKTAFNQEGRFSCSKEEFSSKLDGLGIFSEYRVLSEEAINNLVGNFEDLSGIKGREDWCMVNQSEQLILVSDVKRYKINVKNCLLDSVKGGFSFWQIKILISSFYKCLGTEGATEDIIHIFIAELVHQGIVEKFTNDILKEVYRVKNEACLKSFEISDGFSI